MSALGTLIVAAACSSVAIGAAAQSSFSTNEQLQQDRSIPDTQLSPDGKGSNVKRYGYDVHGRRSTTRSGDNAIRASQVQFYTGLQPLLIGEQSLDGALLPVGRPGYIFIAPTTVGATITPHLAQLAYQASGDSFTTLSRPA